MNRKTSEATSDAHRGMASGSEGQYRPRAVFTYSWSRYAKYILAGVGLLVCFAFIAQKSTWLDALEGLLVVVGGLVLLAAPTIVAELRAPGRLEVRGDELTATWRRRSVSVPLSRVRFRERTWLEKAAIAPSIVVCVDGVRFRVFDDISNFAQLRSVLQQAAGVVQEEGK